MRGEDAHHASESRLKSPYRFGVGSRAGDELDSVQNSARELIRGTCHFPRAGQVTLNPSPNAPIGILYMKSRSTLILLVALSLSAFTTGYSQVRPADPSVPHLEKRGAATQMIIDGKPYLMLVGELANTASSNLDEMQTNVWPMLAGKVHANTIITGMAWAWVEPEEGKYDFTIADAAIANARKHDLHIIWMWFGSWKNGLSSFAPTWVKANQERFPRAKILDGKSVEVLTPLSENNRNADARAFAALMRHCREVDTTHRVVMVQVENEVGLLGDSRDRSDLASAAYAQPVPKQLIDYIVQHREQLQPEFRKVWEAAGAKTAGTWADVFGQSPQAEEIFMAWYYARYADAVAQAGKQELPVPMYMNSWLVQDTDKTPGDWPTGGPVEHNHDLYRAGAPGIDVLSGDFHGIDFVENATRYTRFGNPLFTPEERASAEGIANAFLAYGHFKALGWSVIGIDSVQRLQGAAPGGVAQATAAPVDPANLPLSQAYNTLGQLAPFILEHQSKGTIEAVQLDKEHPDVKIKLGDYTLNVGLQRNRRALDVVPDIVGYGLFMAEGPNDFLMVGNNVQVTFTPNAPGEIAGLAWQEAGRFENGKWIRTRILGGDDSVLRYDFPNIVAMGQSGSGVRLTAGERGIQKVKVYRYK